MHHLRTRRDRDRRVGRDLEKVISALSSYENILHGQRLDGGGVPTNFHQQGGTLACDDDSRSAEHCETIGGNGIGV